MVEYNIIKSCRLCRKKFVVKKQDANIHYCSVCDEKLKKIRAEEAKNEKNSE